MPAAPPQIPSIEAVVPARVGLTRDQVMTASEVAELLQMPISTVYYLARSRDEVQIRRTIAHPEHGQLRNGTLAQVADIDPDAHTIRLRLADGQKVTLDREQAARADLRLAYVQHPFPAQGQTTDTAHLIIGEHATQEGSYVALTRAREQTHIHAASTAELSSEVDRLQALSERMSWTEPDLPSIQTPVAHESAITAELARTSIDPEHSSVAPEPTAEGGRTPATLGEQEIGVSASRRRHATGEASARGQAQVQLDQDPEIAPKAEPAADRPAQEVLDDPGRTWPRTRDRDPLNPEAAYDQSERDHHHGWEP